MFEKYELLIGVSNEIDQAAFLNIVSMYNVVVLTYLLNDSNIIHVQFKEEHFDILKEEFAKVKGVLYVEENMVAFSSAPVSITFTDTKMAAQDATQYDSHIKIHEAWAVTQGSDTINIAIVDSGVDPNHPDITGQLIRDAQGNVFGISYLDAPYDSSTLDVFGHGTMVASCAAAASGNNYGVVGTAPKCKIVPVRVSGSNGGGTEANIIAGINWAANNNCKVINISMGYEGSVSSSMQTAVNYAISKGCTVVVAAGNDGLSTSHSPAWATGAIGVAGTASGALTLDPSSSRGTGIDVCAPFSDYLAFPTYPCNAWCGANGQDQIQNTNCLGSDNKVYCCKLTHVPTPDTEPGVGANWQTYWVPTNGVGASMGAFDTLPWSTSHVDRNAINQYLKNSVGVLFVNYGSATGTSFASPTVAGIVALLYSINPNFTSSDIYSIITTTATTMTGQTGSGYGKVNAYAAVQEAWSRTTHASSSSIPVPGNLSATSKTTTAFTLNWVEGAGFATQTIQKTISGLGKITLPPIVGVPYQRVTDDFDTLNTSAWTNPASAYQLLKASGGYATGGTAGTNYCGIYTGTTFDKDQYAEAKIGSLNTSTYLLVRATPGSYLNAYMLYFIGTTFNILRIANGVATTVKTGTLPFSLVSGDIVRFEVSGVAPSVTLKAYVGKTLYTNVVDTYPSAPPASGYPGVMIYGGATPSTLDSFAAGNISPFSGAVQSGKTSVAPGWLKVTDNFDSGTLTNWTTVSGMSQLFISGGGLIASGDSFMAYTGANFYKGQYVQAKIVTHGSVYLTLRTPLVSTSPYYAAKIISSGAYIYKWTGSTWTLLYTNTTAIPVGSVVRFSITDAGVMTLNNLTNSWIYAVVTDNTVTAAGYPGVRITTTGKVDDFEAGNISAVKQTEMTGRSVLIGRGAQDINGKSSIKNIVKAYRDGKAAILLSFKQSRDAKTSILKTRVAERIGSSRIEKSFYYDLIGKSRITKVNKVNTYGISRITKVNKDDLNGISKIVMKKILNITGKARIEKVFSSGLSGRTSVYKSVNKELLGQAFVLLEYQRQGRLGGKSNILKILAKARTGSTRVTVSNPKDMEGKASIFRVRRRSINARSSVEMIKNDSMSGVSYVQWLRWPKQDGRARILGWDLSMNVRLGNDNHALHLTTNISDRQAIRIMNKFGMTLIHPTDNFAGAIRIKTSDGVKAIKHK